jgi:hypothetical protein
MRSTVLWTGLYGAITASSARPDAATAGADRPLAPSGPQHARRKRGPSPFAVAAVAIAVGALLAKAIDWRSHAHPRR